VKPMRVRAAGHDDIPALIRLNAEVQALHIAAEPDRYRVTAAEEVEAWFRMELRDEAVVALLAEDETGPVGYAMVRLADSPGHAFALPRRSALVNQLGVAPAARRRGIGRALMAAVEAQARAWAAADVVLDVVGFNLDALAFYRAAGYEVAKTRLRRRL